MHVRALGGLDQGQTGRHFKERSAVRANIRGERADHQPFGRLQISRINVHIIPNDVQGEGWHSQILKYSLQYN